MESKLIRSTKTHDYYAGSCGEISVPKHTRICTVCFKTSVLNMDEVSYHKQHGGKLVPIDQLKKEECDDQEPFRNGPDTNF